MVLLTEIESTAHGLMGSTVDDIVVRLSEPSLEVYDHPTNNLFAATEDPEENLRKVIRQFGPADMPAHWSREKLGDKWGLFHQETREYIKDPVTDPFHFYQLGKFHHNDVDRCVAAVAVYREWGLRDPREGEYFKWHKEKERIWQTVERGVEAVFDYVVGCIFGGTLAAKYDTTEPIRNYIAKLKQEVLEPEADQQKWRAMLDVSSRHGPKDKKQDFWPHFKYLRKVITEK